MTEEQIASHWQRVRRALETSDVEARLAERQAANREGRLLRENRWEVPQQPKPVHPPVRRPHGPRDWEAERAFFESGTDQKIAALRDEISAGVGEVIASEREAAREQLDQLRAELRLEFRAAIAEALTAVLQGFAARGQAEAQSYERIARGVDRLERLLMHLSAADSTEGAAERPH